MPKRRAPEAKPVAAMGPRASGGAMFLTEDGGGIVAVVVVWWVFYGIRSEKEDVSSSFVRFIQMYEGRVSARH